MQHLVVGKLLLIGVYVVFKEMIQQRQELCFKVIVSLIRAQIATVKLFSKTTSQFPCFCSVSVKFLASQYTC
mgnify:CR=1 FL=1